MCVLSKKGKIMKMFRSLFGSMLLGVLLMNGSALIGASAVKPVDAQVETLRTTLKSIRTTINALEAKYPEIVSAQIAGKKARIALASAKKRHSSGDIATAEASIKAARVALGSARKGHSDVLNALAQEQDARKALKTLKIEDAATEDNSSN